MNEIRPVWEPENQASLDVIESQVGAYIGGTGGGVSVLKNGTLLFIRGGSEADARRAMDRAKFFADFSVRELKEGGYFVVFDDAVAVFVGVEEFEEMRGEILNRLEDLKLPGERVLNLTAAPLDHYLIGLYGRGKLYRDAYDFEFHKRIGA